MGPVPSFILPDLSSQTLLKDLSTNLEIKVSFYYPAFRLSLQNTHSQNITNKIYREKVNSVEMYCLKVFVASLGRQELEFYLNFIQMSAANVANLQYFPLSKDTLNTTIFTSTPSENFSHGYKISSLLFDFNLSFVIQSSN